MLGPGRIGVYAGRDLVATLERGMIEATTTDVFTSDWLPRLFRPNLTLEERGPESTLNVADDALVRMISQHMVRRAVFLIRQAGNGSTWHSPIGWCVTSTTPARKRHQHSRKCWQLSLIMA